MKPLLKSEFQTKDGLMGTIITRKRVDGNFVTTFEPQLGLSFHSIDANLQNSHQTVKNFLRDVKGCQIIGEAPPPPVERPKRFIS